MADIKNIKLGDSEPESIMFDSPNTWIKPGEFDYFKFANDAGGYFVHGLWIAPFVPWGTYSWPWDLGVTSGGLKDVNDGYSRWGYVQDGVYKNLTSGMNKSFPENVKGDYKVAISVWFNTPNYTDDSGRACLDLGDRPIVITFLDGRFDNYNWVLQAGAVAEWSTDKRTCTIHRIPASKHCVFISDNSDKTIATVRKDLSDVYADVSGLTYHYRRLVVGDPSSVECWDAHVGDEQVYHKDRTLENCWTKYGIGTVIDVMYEGIRDKYFSVNMSGIPSDITSPVLPSISDLEEYLQPLYDSDKPLIIWNHPIHNIEFWDAIKQYYATHPFIYVNSGYTNTSGYTNADSMHKCMNLFKNSGITGDVHIIFDGNEIYNFLSEVFYGCTLNKVTIELRHESNISSLQYLFRKANVKEIEVIDENGNPKKFNAHDFDTIFEYGNPPEIFPDIIKNTLCLKTSIQFAFSYCIHLKVFVPVRNWDIIVNNGQQAFQQCNSLVKIGPVLNVGYINNMEQNDDTTNNMLYMFNGCTSLTDVRIKNLNGSYVKFDDSHIGNIPNLDAESIQYLFDNLTDLSTYSEDADHSDVSNLPKAPHGDLYCPAKWGEYTDDDGNIVASKVTDDMIAKANARNWDVYIGGVLVSPNMAASS